MVLFGAEIEYNTLMYAFIKDMRKRLKDPKISGLFLSYNIELIDSVLIINLISIFPQIVFFGLAFICLALAVIFNIITFLVIGGIFIILGSVLFAPKFYFFVFKKGLKKAGYNNKINYLSHEEIIKRCLL